MSITTLANLFRAGGTLPPDAPSYIERPADAELFAQLRAGQLCYVLTARQMGKSSLMERGAARLRKEGHSCAVVDLSALGEHLSAEQWYLGILRVIARDLELVVDPIQWWATRSTLSPAQRFGEFLVDIALVEKDVPLVIFVDEIDTTLRLPFSDDFFAAIRALYNRRAGDPRLRKLNFCLIGVAAPGDLIKAPERTPFNVGKEIELNFFSRRDALPLEAGLDLIAPDHGASLLDRIFYWTSGHPYQTQRLCTELATRPSTVDMNAVDAAVERLFLGPTAPEESLRVIERNLRQSSDRSALLQLYQRVLRGAQVPEDRRSPLHNQLRLSGISRTEENALVSSNRIFMHAFDEAWVQRNLRTDRQLTVIVSAIAIILLIGLFLWFYLNYQERVTVEGLKADFQSSSQSDTNARTVRALRIAQLYRVSNDGGEEGRLLFFKLSHDEQLAIIDIYHQLSLEDQAAFQACICGEISPKWVPEYEDRKVLLDACNPPLQGEP